MVACKANKFDRVAGSRCYGLSKTSTPSVRGLHISTVVLSNIKSRCGSLTILIGDRRLRDNDPSASVVCRLVGSSR